MANILYDQPRCTRVAEIFKTLGHWQRLFIICCLCEKEQSVGELQRRLGARQSVISQHLNRMRREGIVASRRAGMSVHYRIADPRLPDLIRGMEKIFRG